MSDDNAPESKQGEPGDKEEFVEKTVLVNPNVIENYWHKRKSPLCYFKKWRYLNLHVKDYEFVRSYQSLTTDWGDELGEIIDEEREGQALEPAGEDDEEKEKGRKRREFRHLAKRAREDFDVLSEKEQSDLRWAHLNYVRPAEQRRKLALVGWGEIERNRSIEVFSVGTKEKADEIKYRKTFHRVRFSIHEGASDTVGRLMHWTEELRRYDDDDPGEDYLVAEIHVKEGTLTELEQEIRQRGGNVPLEVYVEAHLFQYEVDESLAEPDHYQSYNMIFDTPSSIILTSIVVGAEPKPQTEDDDQESYFDDEEREEVPDSDAQFREGMLSAVSNLGASLGHIKIALWVLAIILLFSLFI